MKQTTLAHRSQRASWWVLTLLFLLFGIFPSVAQAEETLSFYVTPEFPESQVEGSNSYFDLNLAAGATETLALKLQNVSSDPIQVQVTPHTAYTNVHGVVEYGKDAQEPDVHSFIFEQMDYVIGTGEVEVSYRDAATNEEIIPSQLLEIPFKSEAVLNPNSGIDDEPYLLGYDYSHVETDALYFDETNNTIKPEAERRNVTYFFNRAESEVTIHYIDDAGTVISPSDTIIGYVNEELEVTIKEIENYKFLFERDNQLLNTVFTREQQNYWLVYILQGSMPPVDPLDPEIEVNPENKPELPENQGLLSIDFISSFNFGSQPISVHDQTYYAQPQRLLDEDGTVNEMEERPNYVQISDRRSATERNGWQLSVTQTKQFEGLKNQQLTGASITFSNQQLVTAQGGDTPSLQTANPLTLVPGNKRALIRAEDTEGTGTWIYRFGDEHTARESVTLNVPKGSNPEATSYSTTLIWELNAIPDN